MYGILLTTGHILIIKSNPGTGNNKGIATIEHIPSLPAQYYKEITDVYQNNTAAIKAMLNHTTKILLDKSKVVCTWSIKLYDTTTGQPYVHS